MRLDALRPRDRKALVLGAVVIGPVLLWRFALNPYVRAATAANIARRSEAHRLVRDRTLLREARNFPDRLDTLSQQLLKIAPRLFGSTGAATAPAQLAAYIESAAKQSDVRLASVTPLPATDSGGALHRIRVSVAARNDLEGALTFLRGLETGQKMIRIHNLRLAYSDRSSAGNNRRPESLELDFEAGGFALDADAFTTVADSVATPEESPPTVSVTAPDTSTQSPELP